MDNHNHKDKVINITDDSDTEDFATDVDEDLIFRSDSTFYDSDCDESAGKNDEDADEDDK